MAPKSSMKAKVYVFIYTWIGSAYFENMLKIRKRSYGKIEARKSLKKLWILKSVKIRTSRFFSPEGAPRNALLPLNYFFTCENTSEYETKTSTNSLLSFLFFFASLLLFFFSFSFLLLFLLFSSLKMHGEHQKVIESTHIKTWNRAEINWKCRHVPKHSLLLTLMLPFNSE